MSSRCLLYENFDQAAHVAIGSISSSQEVVPEESGGRIEPEIARRESFEAGRVQGVVEGRCAALEEAEVRLAHDLPRLLVNLGGAAEALDGVRRVSERDALRLTEAALRQILPIMADRGLGQEAAALVASVIANVPTPVIEVRATSGTREVIERHCDPLPSGVTLATDPEMPEGGVRCAWAHGQARFDGAAVTEATLAILDRCFARIDRDPSGPHPKDAETEN